MATEKTTLVEDLTLLWELSSLSAEDFDILFTQVSEAPPSPRLGVLTDAVAQEHQDLIYALVSLENHFSLDEAGLSELLRSHIEQITELPQDQILEEQIAQVIDRSLRLCYTRPIRIHSSSARLRREHEHTFLDASIVTDLRPIIDSDPETGNPRVVALLRRHNLHLITHDYERKSRKHYLVLDDEDLRYLVALFEDTLDLIPTLGQFTEQDGMLDLNLS